jgi:four helix bundle protein
VDHVLASAATASSTGDPLVANSTPTATPTPTATTITISTSTSSTIPERDLVLRSRSPRPPFPRLLHPWVKGGAEMENDEGFRFQKLDAYKVAREIAVRVHEARISDAELRDQATRAAKSAFLGLCEGLPNEMPGLRRRYFTQSRNSVCELAGAVDLSAAIGAMDAQAAETVLALALRLKRMLRALLNGTGR